MKIESLVGNWSLIGSIASNSEISFIGEEPDPLGVKNWLNGKATELVEQIEPTSGLTLNIDAQSYFCEEKAGNPQVRWFDHEGVLEPEVAPFNGMIQIYRYNAYLQPSEVPAWAIPSQNRYGVILHYDDGDTKICDRIELIGEKLVRTVNVVTDELYLDRVVIVYQRS